MLQSFCLERSARTMEIRDICSRKPCPEFRRTCNQTLQSVTVFLQAKRSRKRGAISHPLVRLSYRAERPFSYLTTCTALKMAWGR